MKLMLHNKELFLISNGNDFAFTKNANKATEFEADEAHREIDAFGDYYCELFDADYLQIV